MVPLTLFVDLTLVREVLGPRPPSHIMPYIALLGPGPGIRRCHLNPKCVIFSVQGNNGTSYVWLIHPVLPQNIFIHKSSTYPSRPTSNTSFCSSNKMKLIKVWPLKFLGHFLNMEVHKLLLVSNSLEDTEGWDIQPLFHRSSI